MKFSFTILISVLVCAISYGQEIPAVSKKPVFEGPKTSSGLPSVLLREEPKPDFILKDDPTKPKPFEMTTKNDLLTRADLIKQQWAEDSKIEEEFGGDQYLGDFKTGGKFVEIYCRDDQYVDGDRIRVFVNGEMIHSSVSLTAGWTPVLVNLKPGFNTIEFLALNQGSSGPNTAAFAVFDEKGISINSSRWNLLTGAKASMIVVKN